MARILGFVNLYDSPSLGELTAHRTPASTSFIGRFALIDFALSNFTNARINNINILIKDNFRSVAKHCGSLKFWASNTKKGIQNYLINEKGISDPNFNSDLNAIRENDWTILEENPDYIVIQPAHIVTTINLGDMIHSHIESGADITMAYTQIDDANEAFLSSRILDVKDGKVVKCSENKGAKAKANVSLRTYVFSRKMFDKILKHKDFKSALSLRSLLEKIVNEQITTVNAYKYVGYARCFDSFKNFMKYSFELLNIDVAAKLFLGNQCKVYTISRNTPPSVYLDNALVTNSFVANGARIGGKVTNSIISRYVTVEEGAEVKDSIILTRTVIKKGASVENALIDKYSTISGKVKGTKNKPKWILIDEAQFLTREHVIELTDIVDILKIPVICYGLRADFQDNLFPGSEALFVYADALNEMKTICECGEGATRNIRFVNNIPVFEGNQVAIDGENEVGYESLCGKCYLEKVLGITLENSGL